MCVIATYRPPPLQGHNGPQLLTFHRAWLLQLEQSLLAVNPSLGALPYWHMPLDQPGGRYHGTSRYIFSQRYAGSISGNPQAGYGMSSGGGVSMHGRGMMACGRDCSAETLYSPVAPSTLQAFSAGARCRRTCRSSGPPACRPFSTALPGVLCARAAI
jgi:hypothetical protein